MRIPNIFTDKILTQDETVTLQGQTAQHLSKVLRMAVDDEVRLFNNTGLFYTAKITHCDKKAVSLNVISSIISSTESKLHTHLGQVMSRGDRMDYVIQKSTELGVNEITPLFSDRCELKLNAERQAKRIQHWQQIAINAAEQCGRAYVPIIHPVLTLDKWINNTKDREGVSLVLHHRDTQNLSSINPAPKHVNLLIGPEGGLSQTEIEQAIHANFIASTFGPRVMRTETTPIASLSILQWLWGDFQ